MSCCDPPNAQREAFRVFADGEIAPRAAQIDNDQAFPEDLIQKIAAAGYLAPWLPVDQGGQAMSLLDYGSLNAEFGRVCSSARSLLTCHGIVTQATARWGEREQREEIVPRLAAGEQIAALAITEANAGSDVGHPETIAAQSGEGFTLTGEKLWVTFAQRADLFLILALLDDMPATFLVERSNPGLSVSPIRNLLGTRGAMLGNVRLDNCLIPGRNLLGKPGFGFRMVVATALDHGRYSVACGCAGLLRACLDASVAYTATRRQFGTEIRNHQLVSQKITDMMTSLRCAERLCEHAGMLRDKRDPAAIIETSIAKYYAASAARQAADDAVQLHGAYGVSDEYPVARYYRDAKIMEIIEGSQQIHQTTIAKHAYIGLAEHAAEVGDHVSE